MVAGSGRWGHEDNGLDREDGFTLAAVAADAVRARLRGIPVDGRPPRSPALRRTGCSFVTLKRSGELRGCIGSLDPVLPLYRDVARNAAKAMHDPRTPAVTADEWPALDVSVAVLGPAVLLPTEDREELLRELRTGDGLVLSQGERRATFLPTVWSMLPDPADFVAALLRKGGWPTDRWPRGLTAHRYWATEYRDPRIHPPLEARAEMP